MNSAGSSSFVGDSSHTLPSWERPAIFYTSERQRHIAKETTADVNASGLWRGARSHGGCAGADSWEAEPEHQDYLERTPNGYTCHFVRPDWEAAAAACCLKSDASGSAWST